ncbi:MAG: DNA polymerase III subunit alpha, partial [Alphaproteobacteria bacterium RIFOXYD12_FULL_60_8]
EHDALCRLSRQGLAKRLEVHVYTPQMSAEEKEQAAKRYGERLDYELGVIAQMGFCGYFLIVADFIQWAKDHGIPVGPGRGSGAGSAVAWALTITDLDPLRFGLLFERFLNPERVSMPDFDIDFCQDRREEVIRYVQQEYGRDKVAQIITFGKLQARAALRDVGRVLQMPYGQVDRICKLVPNQPGTVITLPQALESETELRRERDQDETVAQMLDIAMKIEGLYRHASTHAAGVVIGDRPLDELVPLYRDPKSDMPVTQFNMKWVESAGLVKFDFLGLKTLTVLDKAVRLLAKRGVVIDLATIPFNDPATFAMLGRGDAVGVFQLESTGMRDVVRNMKPDSLEDLIAVVALYRPGPMDNIPSYIKRKHGEEKIDYLYPSLKPILEETYGIIIYQEQVMQIAQELSGYTLGGADLLRRAMGKKIASEMDQQRGVFTTGATARGVPEAKAKEIFDLVDKFANYGFNKSHAAAYAVVAYQTAYLKANYPVEFIAASMTLDMTNTDKLNVFRGELLRLGVSLLPPDVNSSLADFSVEDGKVRYALAAVRNVGEAAMRALVAERERGGPFASLSDFTRRMEAKTVNKRLLENLIKAGALDDLEPNRARLMEGIETILGVASLAASERASNQLGMFGGADQTPALKLPQVADWPPMEKLAREFESIGFYLSSHPLDAYGASLERLRVVPSAQLRERVERGGGGHLKLAGTVVSRKERTSKSGNRYAFVSLSDASGAFEVTFFSETLSAARAVLDSGVPVLLTVDARIEEDQLRITAQSCEALDNAVSKSTKRLEIRINSEAPLADLKAVIGEERKGRGEIVLVTCLGSEDVDIKLPGGYAL